MTNINLVNIILEENVTTITEFAISEEDYNNWNGNNIDFLIEKDRSSDFLDEEQLRKRTKKIIKKIIAEK